MPSPSSISPARHRQLRLNQRGCSGEFALHVSKLLTQSAWASGHDPGMADIVNWSKWWVGAEHKVEAFRQRTDLNTRNVGVEDMCGKLAVAGNLRVQ